VALEVSDKSLFWLKEIEIRKKKTFFQKIQNELIFFSQNR
jgi:hypothetical protein